MMSARRQALTVFLSVLVSICVYPGGDWLSSGLLRARPSALFAFSAPPQLSILLGELSYLPDGVGVLSGRTLAQLDSMQTASRDPPKIVEALRRDRFSRTALGTSVTRRPLKADLSP